MDTVPLQNHLVIVKTPLSRITYILLYPVHSNESSVNVITLFLEVFLQRTEYIHVVLHTNMAAHTTDILLIQHTVLQLAFLNILSVTNLQV